jgi:hypothetical protein
MRAGGRSGWLTAMEKTILALAAVATLAVAAPASADPSPPTEGGVSCHQTVKRSYRLGQVARRGLAARVTCDGPIRILVMPDFSATSAADRELYETYGSHIPAVAKAKEVELDEAGAITVRPRFTKVGRRILGHHAKTKILVGLGTMRTDGHYWSDPGDWGETVIRR